MRHVHFKYCPRPTTKTDEDCTCKSMNPRTKKPHVHRYDRCESCMTVGPCLRCEYLKCRCGKPKPGKGEK